MAAPSDRILLRWLPLALLVATVVLSATMFLAHPFGSQDWPRPPHARTVERVIDVGGYARPD